MLKEGVNLAEIQRNARRLNRAEILQSEWTVLIGESLVAMGSIVVVMGLIRAFRALVRDNGV